MPNLRSLATFENKVNQDSRFKLIAMNIILAQLSTVQDVEAETLYSFDSMLINIAIFFVVIMLLLSMAAGLLVVGKMKEKFALEKQNTNTGKH